MAAIDDLAKRTGTMTDLVDEIVDDIASASDEIDTAREFSEMVGASRTTRSLEALQDDLDSLAASLKYISHRFSSIKAAIVAIGKGDSSLPVATLPSGTNPGQVRGPAHSQPTDPIGEDLVKDSGGKSFRSRARKRVAALANKAEDVADKADRAAQVAEVGGIDVDRLLPDTPSVATSTSTQTTASASPAPGIEVGTVTSGGIAILVGIAGGYTMAERWIRKSFRSEHTA